MNYYDNVKDTVRNSKSTSGGSFDTLKEAAEESVDEEGDDTPIEVLEEGGLREKTSSNNEQEQETTGSSVNSSSLEKKLDRIIEQNDKMIEILESFKG